jgi:hypothetical protein
MTPEKRAELLHYAADNPDARFKSGSWTGTGDIEDVFRFIHYDWEIYHEPKDEVSYGIARRHLFFLSLEEVTAYITHCKLTGLLIIKHTKSPNGEVKVEVVE